MSTILSLDISSRSTGYSIFKNKKLHKYGIIDTSKIKLHSERLLFFEKEVSDLISKYSPDYIAAEDIYKGRNPKTHKVLALYHGIAYKLCFLHTEDDPLVLYPGEIRTVVGDAHNVVLKKKGEKDKVLTFNFIKEFYDFKDFTFNKHNDITDAIAIGMAIVEILKGSDYGSLQDFRGCARSRRKGNKKGVSKTRKKVSSRSKSGRSKSRGKVQGSK